MKNKTIGFIGGDRTTNIFLQAFKSANVSFNKVVVFDPNTESTRKLQNNFTQTEFFANKIMVKHPWSRGQARWP